MKRARRYTTVFGCLGALGACSPARSADAPSPATSVAHASIAPPTPTVPPAPTQTELAVADAGPATPSVLETALTEWSKRTACDAYDYAPNGGIQNLWCHRPSRLTVAAVQSMAGVDIFASGPHTDGGRALRLDDANAFGHYNPAFVQWLLGAAGPSPRGTIVQKATQSAYDAHLKPLAEIFWRTQEKIAQDPACFAREQSAYAAAIARKKLPKNYYERWFFFMNPLFCSASPAPRPDTFYFDRGMDGGFDGNVTKTVVGFWLRRSMDGTMPGFVEGLKKLVASYQPELLATPYRSADAAEINKALDAGAKAAAACKSPSGKSAMTPIDIIVSTDGELHARPGLRGTQASPELTCIEDAFKKQHVAPFSGKDLGFSRSILTTLPRPPRGSSVFEGHR